MLRRYIRDYDYTLLFLTLALLGFGLVMLRSGAPPDPNNDFFQQQVVWVGLGLVMMGVMTSIDYRFVGAWARPLYVGILLALGLIFLLGDTAFGAQRWFAVLDRQVQPSEFAKLMLIISLARYLADREGSHRAILISGVGAALPIVLVLLQPNLSTSIILGVIWLSMAIIAGMPLRWLLGAAVAGVLLVALAWPYVPQYQQDRLTIFMDPAQDPAGQGFNLIQSRIAIGGGGLMGQGYNQGSQSQLGYLRVRHTDFIFSVIAEELGFLGALVLFALLIALMIRLIHRIGSVVDPFGRLLIAGVAGWIFFQTFVNIGVNVGVVPPTGVPLPFISYGGSNIITLLFAMGIVESVVIRQRKLDFD